jgi:hypothetical protein
VARALARKESSTKEQRVRFDALGNVFAVTSLRMLEHRMDFFVIVQFEGLSVARLKYTLKDQGALPLVTGILSCRMLS